MALPDQPRSRRCWFLTSRATGSHHTQSRHTACVRSHHHAGGADALRQCQGRDSDLQAASAPINKTGGCVAFPGVPANQPQSYGGCQHLRAVSACVCVGFSRQRRLIRRSLLLSPLSSFGALEQTLQDFHPNRKRPFRVFVWRLAAGALARPASKSRQLSDWRTI